MKIFKLQKQDKLTDFEYLEQIYKKVKLGELVKLNGKAYMRIVPKNNKYFKHPYHFYCAVNDIYKGNVLFRDKDGEFVNSGCQYKIEFY